MFDDCFTGYSNALEAFPEEFNWRWVARLQSSRIDTMLVASAAMLDHDAPGLSAMIADAMARLPTDPKARFDWLWCPEPSLLSLARDPDGAGAATGRAAALALHFAACGVPGEWRADFVPPVGLRFDRWWIADVERAALRAEGNQVALDVVASGRAQRLMWQRDSADWHMVEGGLAAAPQIDWHGARIRIMPVARGQATKDMDVIPATDAMRDDVRRALDLIEASSPAYVEWVARMLRIIVPWRPSGGAFRNASNPNCCSCVMLTIHPDTPRIAETFVHEVSHHYFDVLECVSPLVNGRDLAEYWSPPRKELRPLRAILVAHHAFVNCMLYYQLQAARGISMPSDFGRTFDELVDWQAQLESHLAGSDGLSDTGTMLWRRLADRVAMMEKAIAA